MTKERFTEIMQEFDYHPEFIQKLWDGRPEGVELKEERLRETAQDAKVLDRLFRESRGEK